MMNTKASANRNFQNLSLIVLSCKPLIFNWFLLLFTTSTLSQSWKTSHLRGFVFSNYRNLNNGNLLLESGKILKQKWHKTTKNGMLKLTYMKALWKYVSSIVSTAFHFRALKSNASLNLNLMIRFGSRII